MEFDNNKLYSMQEVAEALGIHPNSLRNFRLEGRVKVVRIGRVYRISGAEVNYIMANGLRPITDEYRAEVARLQANYRAKKAAQAAEAEKGA